MWGARGAGPRAPPPIWLPPLGTLGSGDALVAGGTFLVGTDEKAFQALPRQIIHLDDFIIKRHPVTVGEFLEFLNARFAEAPHQAPLAECPGYPQNLLYALEAGRGYSIRADRGLHPDLPVFLVDWESARAYARWRSEVDGLRGPARWRLPWELEWAKAAGGVDGRFFPWGDIHDLSFCRMQHSEPGRARIARVTDPSYAADESVYGVRGMAGNARDWCLDAFARMGPRLRGRRFEAPAEPHPGAHRATMGGSFGSEPHWCRIASRVSNPWDRRQPYLGFRLARGLTRGDRAADPG